MILAVLDCGIVARKYRKDGPARDDDVLTLAKIVEDPDRSTDAKQGYRAEITRDAVARPRAIERIAADVSEASARRSGAVFGQKLC